MRKKKKETEEKCRSEKKRMKQLAKREKESKKALDDIQAEMLLQARKKAEAEAAALALEEARLRAVMDRRPSSNVRRKNSIFHSVPKYVPTYRYAPEEKAASTPVQIKQINFKDFDGATGGSSSGSAYGISSSTLSNLYNTINNNPLFGCSGVVASSAVSSPSPRSSATSGGTSFAYYSNMGQTSSYIGEDGNLTPVARPKTSCGYPENLLRRSHSLTASISSNVVANNEHLGSSHFGTLGLSGSNSKLLTSQSAATTSSGIAFVGNSSSRNSSTFNVLYNCDRPSAANCSGVGKSERLEGSVGVFPKAINGLACSHSETVSSELFGIGSDNSVEAAILTNRSKSILYSLPTLDNIDDGTGANFVLPTSARRGSFTRPKSAAAASSSGRMKKQA